MLNSNLEKRLYLDATSTVVGNTFTINLDGSYPDYKFLIYGRAYNTDYSIFAIISTQGALDNLSVLSLGTSQITSSKSGNTITISSSKTYWDALIVSNHPFNLNV